MPNISPTELLILLLVCFTTAFWIWMLVVCAKRDDDPQRLVWIIIIALTHTVGAILYFVVQRPKLLARSDRPTS